jgi:hypothetical protein
MVQWRPPTVFAIGLTPLATLHSADRRSTCRTSCARAVWRAADSSSRAHGVLPDARAHAAPSAGAAGDGPLTQGSVAVSRCTTVHLLCNGIANIFGTSISETTTRRTLGPPAHLAGRHHPLLRHGLGAWRAAVAVALAAVHHDHVYLHVPHARQCVTTLKLEVATCASMIWW